MSRPETGTLQYGINIQGHSAASMDCLDGAREMVETWAETGELLQLIYISIID